MQSVTLNGKKITPSKIICVGRNYVEHINELGNEVPDNMVLFFKTNASISSTLLSYHQEPLHYEAELCFMYQNQRFSAVAAGLDLTKRTLQSHLKSKGLPWERAKAFNGSALFSEFVEIDEMSDDLTITLDINNERRQQGNLSLMLYSPEKILQEISQFIDLEEGDIVMTGTPKGVGTVNSGDIFRAEVVLGKQVLISHVWQAQ